MVKKSYLNKKTILKVLVYTLELLALVVFFYLVFLPFYPELNYKINYDNKKNITESKDIVKVEEKTLKVIGGLKESEFSVSPDRLIITKIGVNSPIIETEDSEYGLSLGSWLVPEGSRPNKKGNTIITGHRFKYLPPSNLTFYLFHKLEKDDIISVVWKGNNYYYSVKETKIVDKTDISILESGEKTILTLFTCHPIYSSEQRLVIISEPIEKP